MVQDSKIDWTNDTWNPWQGCLKVSAGCRFCYMYRDKRRYGQNPAKVVKSARGTFQAPLTKFKGPFVFTCSWSDFFIDLADPWRDEAWEIIRQTPHLIYQILTKRPERITACLPHDWGDGYKNVWLGVTVENEAAKGRADILRGIPAALRFISAEPLLEPVNLNLTGFQWVITGGESGVLDQWRPSLQSWFWRIRDQCLSKGVAFFHKQNGGNQMVDGVFGGNRLDGATWNQFPKFDYRFL